MSDSGSGPVSEARAAAGGGPWEVLATSGQADERTRVLKHGETFALFDRHGDAVPASSAGHGVFHRDTRFLSRLELAVAGRRPLLLNSAVTGDNSLLAVDLTTPDIRTEDGTRICKGSVHLFRAAILEDCVCCQHLRVTNYTAAPIRIVIDIFFGADFADIFEVRGVQRPRRGTMLPVERSADEVVLAYRGLDGVVRRTRLGFSTAPAELTGQRARFELALPPRVGTELDVRVGCEIEARRCPVTGYHELLVKRQHEVAAAHERCASVHTSNEQFNDWLNRSAADLQMLTTETPHGPYPYAGVPWFSTAFGRDGIITALQYQWLYPEIGRGVLAYLAATQARALDPDTDAEPGKILHETRGGEMAALGEVPFGRYYGSIDATPLFIVLAGEHYERTGDRTFLDAIWPALERALTWIEQWGDVDADGFVEYARHSADGLLQQGWKDSDDSVFHADGADAPGPIAVCEVQGYVYRAKRTAARLARLTGELERAAALEAAAAALRERFNAAFWCDDLAVYALALDGNKRPCRVRASNAGHALWSGIADVEHARRLADTLLSPAMYSGWGIRTLAEGEARYNPMSYHNGSVWPHDNAVIAMGLARYGFKEQALAVMTGLFDASLHFDLHRLPELFCGFTRLPGQGPTLYPVACAPQAWASGAPFQLLQACLGVGFAAEAPQLRFDHPRLPPYLDWIVIRNLRVAGAVLDLELTRHARDVGVNVTRKEGNVEIAVHV